MHTVNWLQLAYLKSSLNNFFGYCRNWKISFNSALLQWSKFRDIFILSASSSILCTLFLLFNSFQKCPLQIFFPYLATRCCFSSKNKYFGLQKCQSNFLTWTYLYIVKASKAFLSGMWLRRGSPIRWEPIKSDFPTYLIGHTYRNFQWKPEDYFSFTFSFSSLFALNEHSFISLTSNTLNMVAYVKESCWYHIKSAFPAGVRGSSPQNIRSCSITWGGGRELAN